MHRIGGESDLIVRDQVDRAAGVVPRQRLQVEDFRDDALAGEGRIAVNQNRRGTLGIVARNAVRMIGLQRARASLDDRIDRFEMARIVGEHHVDLLALGRDELAGRAVVVLYVAHHVVVAQLAAILRGFELGHDFFVRHVRKMRDHVEAAAMRHAEHGARNPVVGQHVEHLFEHRDHHVQTLARERLLPHERLAHVAIERVDFRKPLQKFDLPLRRKADLVLARLDVVAQPDALRCVRDVFDLVRDRRAVGFLEMRQHVGQRVPGHLHAQDAGRNRAHQRRRKIVRLRFERRVADRFRAERIEVRGEVAEAPVRGDDRHAGGDRAQHVVRRFRNGGAGDGRPRVGGSERLRRFGGVQTQRREDRFVKTVFALQQFVDATQILARLRALDHAMVVRAGHLHDLGDAELLERLLVRARKSGRIADRTGG